MCSFNSLWCGPNFQSDEFNSTGAEWTMLQISSWFLLLSYNKQTDWHPAAESRILCLHLVLLPLKPKTCIYACEGCSLASNSLCDLYVLKECEWLQTVWLKDWKTKRVIKSQCKWGVWTIVWCSCWCQANINIHSPGTFSAWRLEGISFSVRTRSLGVFPRL